MKTDIIAVSSEKDRLASALGLADKVAAYKGLSAKDALHLRLLAEETVSLVRSVTGSPEGEFWIEDKNGIYSLHLRVITPMDRGKRDQLLSASTSGRNEAARGFMGRIRSFFELAQEGPVFSAGYLPGDSRQMYGTLTWSMCEYKNQLEQGSEAWDELEKSTVAHLADDVRVSIASGVVGMVILKKL